MDASNIVKQAATAAIATDAEDRILAWNDAARELFGFKTNRVIGSNFECSLRNAGGDYQRAAVSVVIVLGPDSSTYQLAHLIWPVEQRRKADEIIVRLLNGSDFSKLAGLEAGPRAAATDTSILTPRQREILRSIAKGETTTEIADSLCISPQTVRNHVGNILCRLKVHSRAEAVSVGLRRGLI